MTDADYMVALATCEHGFKFVPNGRGNWALFVYDIGHEARLHGDGDLRECIERYMRDTARAKTIPPPRSTMTTLRDYRSVRGKP